MAGAAKAFLGAGRLALRQQLGDLAGMQRRPGKLQQLVVDQMEAMLQLLALVG